MLACGGKRESKSNVKDDWNFSVGSSPTGGDARVVQEEHCVGLNMSGDCAGGDALAPSTPGLIHETDYAAN